MFQKFACFILIFLIWPLKRVGTTENAPYNSNPYNNRPNSTVIAAAIKSTKIRFGRSQIGP